MSRREFIKQDLKEYKPDDGYFRNKCLYMAPLKALGSEKKQEWDKRFPNHKVLMLTGDTLYNEKVRAKQMAEAATSDIIITTSELLDSVTRKMKSEKYTWLLNVGLLIVDESHILAMDRGPAVEVGIMRFSQINPHARILLLSATMPNVSELGEWTTRLNGKKTEIINCNWRPVQLQMNYIQYNTAISSYGRMDYQATQKIKIDTAVQTAMEKPDEKYLIFVWDKGTGRKIVHELKQLGEDALFHNADLDFEDRKEIEDSFKNRQGGLRVLVSTNTLAWGCNTPARNCIITGIHRGMQEVDSMDIAQASGRAGRYGIDDAGFVNLIIPYGSKSHWEEVFKNPRDVDSVLNDHRILAFHTLAEISTGNIRNAKQMLQWYQRSLAFLQNQDFTLDDAEGLFSDLERMSMVESADGNFSYNITNLGQISSWLYISPYDIYAFYVNFNKIFKNEIELDDYTLSWALANRPEYTWNYTPKELSAEVSEIQWKLRNRGIESNGFNGHFILATYSLLKGDEMKGAIAPLMRTVRYDIERCVQAISMIDSRFSRWGKDDLWKILPDRIIYGIDENMVQLVKIPKIGGKRAKLLYNAGFHNIEEVANANIKDIAAVLGGRDFAAKIKTNAKQLIN